MSSVETGQMSSVETRQVSAVGTSDMHAAELKVPKALDNIIFWVGGPNLGTVHGEKQPSLYFLCGPLPPRTQFHFQNRLSPFFAQLEAAGTFVGKNATFQLPTHNSPTLWIQPLKLCGVFGNTVAPGRKIPI